MLPLVFSHLLARFLPDPPTVPAPLVKLSPGRCRSSSNAVPACLPLAALLAASASLDLLIQASSLYIPVFDCDAALWHKTFVGGALDALDDVEMTEKTHQTCSFRFGTCLLLLTWLKATIKLTNVRLLLVVTPYKQILSKRDEHDEPHRLLAPRVGGKDTKGSSCIKQENVTITSTSCQYSWKEPLGVIIAKDFHLYTVIESADFSGSLPRYVVTLIKGNRNLN